MKRKSLVAILVGIGLTAATGCATRSPEATKPAAVVKEDFDGKYDNDTRHVDESLRQLEECYESTYKVYWGIIAHNEDNSHINGKYVWRASVGSSLALKGGYALTAHHVVHNLQIGTAIIPQLEASLPEGTTLESRLFLTKDENAFYEVEEFTGKQDLDFSLLKLKQNWFLHTYPYGFGNSDELEVGDFTYLIGMAGREINARPGIISAVDTKGVFNFSTTWYSNGVSPGDSGGPVLAIRDGRFELVGIATWANFSLENIGGGMDINPILDEIRKVDPNLPFLK